MINFLKKKKLLFSMFIVCFISLIFGMLFISILNNNSQEVVKDCILSSFNNIKTSKVIYSSTFFNVFMKSFLNCIGIWIIGISIIGILISFLILIFKSFILGFSFIAIIFTYGFKGIFIGLIYIFPEVLSFFITFLLIYYSTNFSILLFNDLFLKKSFNKKIIMKRYFKVLLLSFIAYFIISLIATFMVPNILKLFNF